MEEVRDTELQHLTPDELRQRLRLCFAEIERLRVENARLQRMVSVAADDTVRARDA
jgi:uncharacterized small protein (DUF1192 family)